MVSEGYSEVLEGQLATALDESVREALAEGGDGESSSSRRPGHSTSKKTEIVDIKSDDEPDEPGRDIERIWISGGDDSDEDEDDVIITSSKTKRRKASSRMESTASGLRPVRAPRDIKEEEENKKSRALKQTDTEVYDVIDEDAMDVDEPLIVPKDQLSGPEARRRSMRKHGAKARDGKFSTTETIEERAERLRIADDVHKLRSLFAGSGSGPGTETKRTVDLVDDGHEDKRLGPDFEQGKLFLVQLPPLTPFLIDGTSVADEPQVKQEPTSTTNTGAIPAFTGAADANAQAGGSGSGTGGRKEPTDLPPPPPPSAKPILQLDGLFTATEPTRLPAGLVGKLRLHRSGKVSLDWGGTDMEARYGTEVDYHQQVVMVESRVTNTKEEIKNDDNDDNNDNPNGDKRPEAIGSAYALGQIEKKLVLIPDWAKLYD